ncbi:hypothetical protein [Roseomonas haemaphysalidis]|uniref:Uncharacterized protein n=1 Tax=Roseomonas haemaphysalidis TaxID=2768162 RepID=A0ABS3KQ82_9PROT|nr:hypothetical protein [Roseomonas haemaphysalidis]MBO1079627.1 hypothetical protein [Roseomonas haemaphysalidis]
MAHEASRAARPCLFVHDAALNRPPPAFTVDPSRLYDVGDQGEVHVAPLEQETRPSGRVWRWWIAAVALNAAGAASTVLAFVLGGRPAGAAMGLVMIGTAPLLGVAPALVWSQRRRLHQRVERRPARFR